MEGLIIKSLGGFYYVECQEGVIQTRGRGILRKDGVTPLVGDIVDIDVFPGDDEEGVLNSVKERKNLFKRPPVANVDLMVVLFSAASPDPNYDIIDRFLVMAESKECQVALCMNKMDLVDDSFLESIVERYSGAYTVHPMSCRSGLGIEKLNEIVRGKKVALAGPSGAGKSTLAGMLLPQAEIGTGEVSEKTGRGKHTTRHVELFHMPEGGMLFDTPGFTSLDLEDMEPSELDMYYPEFDSFRGQCRFNNCMHLNEPGCAVKEGLETGAIVPERYDTYISNLNELLARRRY